MIQRCTQWWIIWHKRGRKEEGQLRVLFFTNNVFIRWLLNCIIIGYDGLNPWALCDEMKREQTSDARLWKYYVPHIFWGTLCVWIHMCEVSWAGCRVGRIHKITEWYLVEGPLSLKSLREKQKIWGRCDTSEVLQSLVRVICWQSKTKTALRSLYLFPPLTQGDLPYKGDLDFFLPFFFLSLPILPCILFTINKGLRYLSLSLPFAQRRTSFHSPILWIPLYLQAPQQRTLPYLLASWNAKDAADPATWWAPDPHFSFLAGQGFMQTWVHVLQVQAALCKIW